MIVKNEQEQYLECTLCGEVTELRRRTLENPETVLLMMEHLKEDHKPCDEHVGDFDRARIERGYLVRMRAELAKGKRQR